MLTTSEMEDPQTGALLCPECDAANLPQRKFCAKCGTSLWETCFQCGEVCAAGENFCGACGVNLDEAAAEQLENVDAALREAAEMLAACRFEEALAILNPIGKRDHPRLAERAARARQLSRQLLTERQRGRTAAQEAAARARQCFDACDYDAAARLIDQVPPPLRSEELESLRADIAERKREIAVLGSELRRAVHEKRLLDLPPQIERLLTLKPDHAYAKALAGRVQERLAAAAEKKLAEHHYDAALHLLERIGPHGVTPRSEELRRKAVELACLSWDLRNAPVIDQTLTAVAERVRRLAPGDARLVRLCDELKRRSQPAGAQQPLEPVCWARPPQETPLGVPVEWLAGFRRFVCAETLDRSDLLRNPGRFAVACGLALAGVKQAAVGIDLLRGQQRGLRDRVAGMIRPKSTRAAWGIDLGGSALKAVRLAWDEAARRPRIEAAVVVEHAKPLSYAANEAEEARLVAETVQAFLSGRQLAADRVCVGLPGRMALGRQFDLPPAAAGKTQKLVEFEVGLQFNLPVEQLIWDFHAFDRRPEGRSCAGAQGSPPAVRGHCWSRQNATSSSGSWRALGTPASAPTCSSRTSSPCTTSSPSSILPRRGDSRRPGKPPLAAAALDVGCDVTNVIVSSPQSLWFHSCGVAGRSFTRALVKEFNLSVAQAEQLKRAPESAQRIGQVEQALRPCSTICCGKCGSRWPSTPRPSRTGPLGNSSASAAGSHCTECSATSAAAGRRRSGILPLHCGREGPLDSAPRDRSPPGRRQDARVYKHGCCRQALRGSMAGGCGQPRQSLQLGGSAMAKQKFYCKGVERASGRRVAVTLSADNKESAVRIAKEHGVLVESVVPAQDPRPAAGRPPRARCRGPGRRRQRPAGFAGR